jgi:hypothetical protein
VCVCVQFLDQRDSKGQLLLTKEHAVFKDDAIVHWKASKEGKAFIKKHKLKDREPTIDFFSEELVRPTDYDEVMKRKKLGLKGKQVVGVESVTQPKPSAPTATSSPEAPAEEPGEKPGEKPGVKPGEKKSVTRTEDSTPLALKVNPVKPSESLDTQTTLSSSQTTTSEAKGDIDAENSQHIQNLLIEDKESDARINALTAAKFHSGAQVQAQASASPSPNSPNISHGTSAMMGVAPFTAPIGSTKRPAEELQEPDQSPSKKPKVDIEEALNRIMNALEGRSPNRNLLQEFGTTVSGSTPTSGSGGPLAAQALSNMAAGGMGQSSRNAAEVQAQAFASEQQRLATDRRSRTHQAALAAARVLEPTADMAQTQSLARSIEPSLESSALTQSTAQVTSDPNLQSLRNLVGVSAEAGWMGGVADAQRFLNETLTSMIQVGNHSMQDVGLTALNLVSKHNPAVSNYQTLRNSGLLVTWPGQQQQQQPPFGMSYANGYSYGVPTPSTGSVASGIPHFMTPGAAGYPPVSANPNMMDWLRFRPNHQ